MAISTNGLIIIALLVTLSVVEIGILVKISSPDLTVGPYLQKIEQTGHNELNSFEQDFKERDVLSIQVHNEKNLRPHSREKRNGQCVHLKRIYLALSGKPTHFFSE